MRILVCGGRSYSDKEKVFNSLDALITWALEPVILIQGGAPGGDRLSKEWAKERNIPMLEFKADWKANGKAAGPIRNKKMLDEGKPTVVLSFPGGRGTAHMVKIAREAGVKVIEVAP